MSLFETLGSKTVARIDALHKRRQIIAVHHQPDGTCLILQDASKLLLEGLSAEDSRRIVGYLGFYGGGEHGLDTPAFAVKPE
jgi:hypothetical protein